MTHSREFDWNRWRKSLCLAGVAGWIVWAAAAWTHPTALWSGYLVGYQFWLGISLGSLVLLWIQRLTGGKWGLLIRRPQEAAAATLPLLAIGFLPLLIGLRSLYPWMDAELVAREPAIQHKVKYLNESFFTVRAGCYFTLWVVLSAVTIYWSRGSDRANKARARRDTRRIRALAGPALAIYGLTITFASVDWIMSLEPRWYSTMFPVIFALGQALAAMALVIPMIIVLGLAKAPSPRAEANDPGVVVEHPTRLQDLGSLLMMFIMLWAYVSFSQFLLIWTGNLPDETRWYLPRIQGGWLIVAILLAGLQFAAPFLLLLSRDIKRNPRALAAVALLVLGMHWIDLAWQILPPFGPLEFSSRSLDIVASLGATVGIGGIWLLAFFQFFLQWPLATEPDAATSG